MDKKKQIEGLANIYYEAMLKARATIGSMNEGAPKWYAKAFYNAGCRKLPDDMGEFSDGYHTFNELYHHRAVLFSVICNMMPEKAWKSKLHNTGDMFNGMFIVGIETEQGQATYHYRVDPYWDIFKVKELERAPEWDGHTPADAIQRIGNIKGYQKQNNGEWLDNDDEYTADMLHYRCSICGNYEYTREKFCSKCGAKMKGGAE